MGKKIRVINQELDNLSSPTLIREIDKAIANNRKLTIATVNPEFMVQSYRDKKFAEILAKFDIKVMDGYGIELLTKIFTRNHFKQRITGVDLTNLMFRLAQNKLYKIMVLGGSATSSKSAQEIIAKQYKDVRIKFVDGGVINPENINSDLVSKLKKEDPDILLVALGSPKQEYFIGKIRDKISSNIYIGVGGTIDFISGKSRRAPKSWRSSGLEWLWRLLHEPFRCRRIFNAVIVFPAIYIKWILSKNN